jgi:hypothetical protein
MRPYYTDMFYETIYQPIQTVTAVSVCGPIASSNFFA